MAYDKIKEFERAQAIIKKDTSIVFIDDLLCELAMSPSTFYKHFPIDSKEMDCLKDLLQSNKTRTKKKLRKQWENVDSSAGLQIALYKLIATAEELERLNPPKEKKEEESEEKVTPLVEWTNSEKEKKGNE
jgi:hypothetical protein